MFQFGVAKEKDGRSRTVVQASSAGLVLRKKGYQWSPTPGDTHDFDGVTYAGSDVEIQSGEAWVSGFAVGDYMEIQVIIPVGHTDHSGGGSVDIALIYASTLYIPPDGRVVVAGDGADVLKAGYVLRVKYTSTDAGTTPQVTAHVKYHG